MKMAVVAGLDPGKKGVMVAVSTDRPTGFAYKLAYDKAGHLDSAGLLQFLAAARPTIIVVEKVQGRSGLGATQTFNFGFACGEAHAIVKAWARGASATLQYTLPQVWQRVIHEGIGGDLEAKERSLLAYERLFPHRPVARGPAGGKPNDNIVDALLLATYGVLKLGGGKLLPWSLKLIGEAELCPAGT